ncbi:MAG: nucleotidyltransferase family protein [Methanoregulaceae archaeon]|nr:nucleotidyltransferase family protein [Methanoregulaceae archaeon]
MPSLNGRIVRAVVPAAGLSRRFGPENKLLQPYGDSTIVGTVVRTLQDAGLPVIVVTGHEAERVSAVCPRADVVFNPDFEDGMGTSVACGVRHAMPCDGIMIALADMPGLSGATIERLIEAFDGEPERIVAPRYASEPDRIGHPIVFGSAYHGELCTLRGDVGARDLLKQWRDRIVWVDCEGGLTDIDVPS